MQIQCMHLYNQHSHSSRWLKVETPTLWWLSIFQRFEKYLEIWNQILDFRIPRWCSGKESTCQCGRCKRCGLDLWVRKTLWIRKWQPTPVILLRKFRGQRSLAGCSPWGWRELEITEHTHTHTHTGLRFWAISSEFSSVNLVAQSYLTLCNPMDCSMPGFRLHHHLLELAQTCPSSWWWHPTISSSVISFSSCLQSFPAAGSFPMRQFFASGGQSMGVSASKSVLPMNTQDWSPLGWTGWISLQSKGLSRVFSNTTIQKHQFFSAKLSWWSNSHTHTWQLEKP